MAREVLAGASVLTLMLAVGCSSVVVTSTSVSPLVAPTSSPAAVPPAGESTSGSNSVGESSATTSRRVLKIGALFPLSGDLGAAGRSALRGMRLAVEEVNEAGGIGSLGDALLTVVAADSMGKAEIAKAELARLVKTEHVTALVGTGQSVVALQVADLAEGLEVPFLVSAGAADEVTERRLAYTFRLCPKGAWYARDQVAFLEGLRGATGLDITAVALLHEQGQFGRETAKRQREYLAEAGIMVVADIEYAPDKADVHNEVLEIKQSGAQAILTATLHGDAALIARDVALLHVDAPVVDAAGGVLDPGFLTRAGTAAEGMMSVAESAPGIGESLRLERTLEAKGEAFDADALYGYQAVWVLVSALERGGSADALRLRAALATTALDGGHLVLPQDLLTFDGTGQNRGARLLVVQVQDGAMVVVWPREYAQAPLRLKK